MITAVNTYLYTLEDVQEYFLNELNILRDEERIEKLYKMISNPFNRVNDKDKQWVAYTTQASEDVTTVNAIFKIAHDIGGEVVTKEIIEDFVDETGKLFEDENIKMKPRIPFYILALSKIFE